MNKQVDIVVVGGGMAGFAAAMAAAQENKRVVLIEKSTQLGGNATNSNVGTICGMYYRTFAENPKMIGYKFCKNFIADLFSLSPQNKYINYHNGLHIISYDWISLSNYMEKLLAKNNVEILKNAEIISVVTQEEKILSIVTQKEELFFKSIVDCSGNGIVSQLANLEMIMDSHYQAASQVFSAKDILSENEFSLNMSLKKAMMKLIALHKLPESFSSLSIVPASLHDNKACFKLTLPDKITDQVNSLHEKAKTYINQLFPLLKTEIESLRDAEIDFIFPQTGIRTQQRSKGKYILAETDIMTCTKPKNGIAMGTWPIEEWTTNGKLAMQYFDVDESYFISADCVQSHQINNLFFGGKNISATQKSIASARVIGTCLQTGYAAGKLAACANKEEKEKMIVSLHQELLND